MANASETLAVDLPAAFMAGDVETAVTGKPEEVGVMACFLIGATGPEMTASREALLGSVSDDPYDVRTGPKSSRRLTIPGVLKP